MRSRVQILALLPIVAILASGCSRTVPKNDLPGRYSVTIGKQRQVIDLHQNGTYDNLLYRGTNLVWRRSDLWSYGYDKGQGDGAVAFAHFVFGLSDYASRTEGFWLVKPERAWEGAIEFCFDPDVTDRCFVREGR